MNKPPRILHYTTKFKKDYKKIKKQGKNIKELEVVIDKLQNRKSLEEKYKDHELSGDYKGFRECHIGGRSSDWLLIYQVRENDVVLVLTRTGSHSDLF